MILFTPSLFVFHKMCRYMTSQSIMSTKSTYQKTTNTDSKIRINAKNKTMKAFTLPGNDRCIVKLLDKYLSLLPAEATYTFLYEVKDKTLSNPSVSSFTNQRVGINVLKNVLPELSEKSGIQVRHTNHSLQATAITRMFNGEVDKRVIAETSGHRSLKALRSYEHTCKRKTKVTECQQA